MENLSCFGIKEQNPCLFDTILGFPFFPVNIDLFTGKVILRQGTKILTLKEDGKIHTMRLLHSSSCLVSTYVHMEKTKLDLVS
jgi:hypothetical protein